MEHKLVHRSDCEQLLKKLIGNDKFEVVNFKVKPFEDKERDYYKPDSVLEISAKIAKNISRFRFFIKKFYADNAKSDLLRCLQAAERESMFYEVFQQVNITPQWFFGDPQKGIIEDMSLKFFTLAKKSNLLMLDRLHLSLALQALAQLHAASWSCELPDNPLMSGEPLWVKNSLQEKVIQSDVKGLKALLKHEGKLGLVEQNLDNLVEQCFNVMPNGRKVLAHGNMHTKNMLFKYDKNTPQECVLINPSLSRYSVPSYDVLTLTFCCTNRMFRQHYFTYLMKSYHERLAVELDKQNLDINSFLTWTNFQKSINSLTPFFKLNSLFHTMNHGAKSGFYRRIEKDTSVFNTYLYEDKSLFMLELYQKDPIFKDMILEGMDELLEVLQHPIISRECCYEILEARLGTTLYDLRSFQATSHGEEGVYQLVMDVTFEEKEEEVKCLVKIEDNLVIEVIN